MDGKFKFKFRKRAAGTPSTGSRLGAKRAGRPPGKAAGRKGGRVRVSSRCFLWPALIGFMAYRNSKGQTGRGYGKEQNTASVERRNITSDCPPRALWRQGYTASRPWWRGRCCPPISRRDQEGEGWNSL